MTYRLVATTGALLFAFLFAELVINVSWLIGPWGVEATPEAGFMGRRLAAGFLGFAVMLWMSRRLEPSPARTALATGIAVALIVVAGFGIWEILRGFAAPGLWLAVAIEVALAAGLLFSGRESS